MDLSAPPPADELALHAALGDPARLAALRAAEMLDAPTEAAFDRLAGLAAKLLGTPLATVTLVDEGRQFYTACLGLPEPVASARETPLELSFCRFTVAAGEPLAIPDTRVDPRTREMASVTEYGVHAYAGVPLFLHGQAIGTLCVMDVAPRDWTAAELDVLGDLGASVMTEIELRLAVREGARQAASLRELTAELEAASGELQASHARLLESTAAADAERRQLEAVLEALPVGVIIADDSGRLTRVNARFAEVWGGAPPAERVADFARYRAWWAETGRPIAAEGWALARALQRGERSADEVIDIARFDGRLATILNAAAPVRDAEGRVTGGVATVLDITDRVRAERTLRQLAAAALAVNRQATTAEVLQEVTEQARAIVGAHQAVASLTTDERWAQAITALSLSEKYRAWQGGTDDEPIAVDGSGIYALVCQTNAPMRLTQEELERHPAFQRFGAYADRHPPLRGWLAAPLVGSDGRNIGLIQLSDKYDGDFTASDTAVLVQLAQMASTTLEKTQADALVRAGAERTRRLLAVTAALTQTVTVEQVAGVVVKAVIDALGAQAASVSVLSPDRRTVVMLSAVGYAEHMVEPWRRFAADRAVPVAEAIRANEPRWLGGSREVAESHPELAVLRDAPEFAAHAVVPLAVDDQALGALVFSFVEPQAFEADDRAVAMAVARQCAQALERARLYEAERRAREAAEAANRAKFDFLATMSHELRTPLNAIGGYVDLMEMGLRGPVTDEQQRDLERVKRAQQHLLGLINDVLNFAKLDAGRVRYAIADVRLGEAVAAVEAMIAPQLGARALTLAAGGCDPSVVARADPEKVRQILLNLLSNALKFTEPGGTITVDCGTDGDQVRVRVADTGVGIPADKLTTIFDPFVQVDRALSRPGEGIGLGLAISRDLARGMGGELTVDSEIGRGSVFTLTLPRP